MLKKDLSGYCWLKPAATATAAHATITLATWNRIYTTPNVRVSDQGSNFIITTLKTMAERFHIMYKRTVAYASSTNGTIERFNGNILADTQDILAEQKLTPQN